MPVPTNDPEAYLRFHRRSMLILLILVVVTGGFFIASALWPDAAMLRVVERTPWLVPILIVIGVAAQQTSMRKHRLALDSPEYKALVRDEWRRQSMDRATRGALITVLVAQLAVPLLFLGLPVARALWGMAATTATLGLAAQVALYLLFERE